MAIDVNGVTLSSSGGTTLNMANGATNWMDVNANGIVTLPQRPYMAAGFSGQATYYQGNPITFGAVVANRGGCWNNSTGLWTCPVAGFYLVTMSGIAAGSAQGVNSAGYIYINKNGATYAFNHWNLTGSWDGCNLTAIVQCAAGDTISMSIANASTSGWYGPGGHCCFGIALVI